MHLPNLLFIGPPGGGKGTEIQILQQMGFTKLSTGDLIRNETEYKSISDKGDLVNDDVVNGLVEKALANRKDGVIFDGYPRNVQQAVTLDRLLQTVGMQLHRVIVVDTPDDLIIRRIAGRYVCKACGATYNKYGNKPRVDGVCDVCKGSEFFTRKDDEESVVMKRLEEYHRTSAELIGFYQSKSLVTRVSGACGDAAFTHHEVMSVLYPLMYPHGLTRAQVKRAMVVFVTGGPGAGKGTQCTRLQERLGWTHLSVGDILRAEVQRGTSEGSMIAGTMKEGKIVPVDTTMRLLRQAMDASSNKRFVIDGFPRDHANIVGWRKAFKNTVTIPFVIYLKCPDDVLYQRLVERSKHSGRSDDNEESIRKRIRVFRETTLPIIKTFSTYSTLHTVTSTRSIEEVYKRLAKYFEEALVRDAIVNERLVP